MPSNSRELLLRGLVAGALAAAVGLCAYLISCLIVPPDSVAKGFGIQWELMSRDPFALAGELPQRILTPLLAWSFGCGGERFVPFTRALTVVLLATVFVFGRRRGCSVPDAALITLAVALISPVQMYKLHWVGYCDPLTYALFFWSLLARRNAAVFWALFLANLLNHELAVFLLPWLWWVRRRQGGDWLVDAFGAGMAVVLYALFYFVVKAFAPAQLFSSDYFLAHPLFPGGTLAVLVVAFVHWTLAFGPILAVIAWHQHDRSNGAERWHLWLVLLGIGAIFCIAWDWARHTNLLVLPLAIASVRFLQPGDRLDVRRAVYAGLSLLGAVLMMVWPPWAPTSWPTDLFTNASVLLETGVVVDLDWGPLSNIATRWLPRVWPVLWPILVIAAAIWGAGALLARRGSPLIGGRAD